MEIQEYEAKKLMKKFGVPTLYGAIASDKSEAEHAVDQVINHTGKNIVVVKAQVLAGGRGKAGGIKVAKSKEEAIEMANKMFGITLHTPQTGKEGKVVHKIYMEEGCDIKREYYLALMFNRERGCLTIMASTEGGMDIEEVAANTPDKICYVDIDPNYGLMPFHIRDVCYGLKLDRALHASMSEVINKLYTMFKTTDAVQIEINPLAVVNDGSSQKFIALDAKVDFDDNALYRQKEIAAMRDLTEEDEGEREAREVGLSYVKMDGTIGCMVNGAGLAMATMDIIKYYGEEPANFLDVGGGADQARVQTAFKIILRDKRVKGILVNVFGGIVHCDLIANGIVNAAREMSIDVPIVVRLVGTKFDIGKKILSESGLKLIAADELDEAAKKIVELVRV